MLPVAAGEQDHHRHPALAAARQLDHQAVAPQHAGRGDPPVADGVVGGRVAARQVVDQRRLRGGEGRRQEPADGVEVGGVVDVRAQLDDGGGLAADLGGGAVVDRKGVDAAVAGEDGARAVVVMEVEVDHQDRLGEALRPQAGDRHRDVVEDAEAFALAGKGVMQAAAEVGGQAAGGQSEMAGEPGAADHGALSRHGALDGILGQLEAEDLQQPVRARQRVEVGVGVNAAQLAEGGELGAMDGARIEQAGTVERRQDAFAALRVVAGEVQLVALAVDQLESGRAQPAAQPPPAPAQPLQQRRRGGAHPRSLPRRRRLAAISALSGPAASAVSGRA